MLKTIEEECFRWNELEDNLLIRCSAAYHDREHESVLFLVTQKCYVEGVSGAVKG
jgi:hypothetical protein